MTLELSAKCFFKKSDGERIRISGAVQQSALLVLLAKAYEPNTADNVERELRNLGMEPARLSVRKALEALSEHGLVSALEGNITTYRLAEGLDVVGDVSILAESLRQDIEKLPDGEKARFEERQKALVADAAKATRPWRVDKEEPPKQAGGPAPILPKPNRLLWAITASCLVIVLAVVVAIRAVGTPPPKVSPEVDLHARKTLEAEEKKNPKKWSELAERERLLKAGESSGSGTLDQVEPEMSIPRGGTDEQGAAVLYNLGREALVAKQWKNAALRLTAAIYLNPKLSFAYNNRGVAYMNLGRSEDAMSDYDKAIELDPKNDAGYTNRGLIYVNSQKDLRKARSDFQQALKIVPESIQALNNLAMIKAYEGDYSGALRDFEALIPRGAHLENLYYNMGCVHGFISVKQALDGDTEAAIGSKKAAIENYLRAIDQSPKWQDPRVNVAIERYALGMKAQAFEGIEKSLQVLPDAVGLFKARAELYMNEGEYAKAITDYTTVLRRSPASISVLDSRGNCYRALGEREKAKGRMAEATAYRKAAKDDFVRAIKAGNTDSYNNLGTWFQEEGNHVAAVREFERAVRANPPLGIAFLNKAMSLIVLDRTDEAREDLAKAQKVVPDYMAEIDYRMACAYSRDKKFDLAFKFLSKAFTSKASLKESAKTEDFFVALRKDPRFARLLAEK